MKKSMTARLVEQPMAANKQGPRTVLVEDEMLAPAPPF